MIWRDDDKRDEQQRKLEYARELERQIELRKALEREQKQQQEEWERQFVFPKDEQSPAKWWTELRSSEAGNCLGFRLDASAMPYTAGEQAESVSLGNGSVSASHQRFQSDPLATHDRLKEKAQQMEWRRLLDEQVREKERRLQQEAVEKRQREQEEAQEEMRFLRERQLRAQRKLGIIDFAPTAAYTPQNYVPIPSPPKEHRHSPLEYGADHDGYGTPSQGVYPPPPPVQAHMRDSGSFSFRRAMGFTESPEQPHDSSHSLVADEYRALLAEIRREREELRRERDELRREKEELRMERQLMQMENEKMATLLESQRHMNEQRLETMERLDQALKARAAPSEAPSPQYTTSNHRPTRLPSPLNVVHRDHTMRQLKTSMASLAIGRRGHPSPVHNSRQSRLGAMSLADFAPAANMRQSPTAANTPRARRLARLRQYDEDPLERSLVAESEFVALSPRAAGLEGAPRIKETRSPAASMMDPRSAARTQGNPLRSSRVIKSRGFYDINREDALPPAHDQSSEFSDDELSEDGAAHVRSPTFSEGENQDDVVHSDYESRSGSHSDSALGRSSLFQVQVLVEDD